MHQGLNSSRNLGTCLSIHEHGQDEERCEFELTVRVFLKGWERLVFLGFQSSAQTNRY